MLNKKHNYIDAYIERMRPYFALHTRLFVRELFRWKYEPNGVRKIVTSAS